MKDSGELPELPNPYRAIQKMRACEGDAAAQLLLEHYAISYASLAVQQERERLAKLCDDLPAKDPDGPWFNDEMSQGAYACAAAIRSIKDDSQEEERKT